MVKKNLNSLKKVNRRKTKRVNRRKTKRINSKKRIKRSYRSKKKTKQRSRKKNIRKRSFKKRKSINLSGGMTSQERQERQQKRRTNTIIRNVTNVSDGKMKIEELVKMYENKKDDQEYIDELIRVINENPAVKKLWGEEQEQGRVMVGSTAEAAAAQTGEAQAKAAAAAAEEQERLEQKAKAEAEERKKQEQEQKAEQERLEAEAEAEAEAERLEAEAEAERLEAEEEQKEQIDLYLMEVDSKIPGDAHTDDEIKGMVDWLKEWIDKLANDNLKSYVLEKIKDKLYEIHRESDTGEINQLVINKLSIYYYLLEELSVKNLKKIRSHERIKGKIEVYNKKVESAAKAAKAAAEAETLEAEEEQKEQIDLYLMEFDSKIPGDAHTDDEIKGMVDWLKEWIDKLANDNLKSYVLEKIKDKLYEIHRESDTGEINQLVINKLSIYYYLLEELSVKNLKKIRSHERIKGKIEVYNKKVESAAKAAKAAAEAETLEAERLREERLAEETQYGRRLEKERLKAEEEKRLAERLAAEKERNISLQKQTQKRRTPGSQRNYARGLTKGYYR